jgi:hypothetical protein
MEENLNIYELIGTSAIFSVILISLLIFFFKTIIKEFFTNAIKYDYNIKLEKLKAELLQNENNIKDLRNSALNGIHFRQSELYKKQIYAVETLWCDVIELSKIKHISTNVLAFSSDYEEIAEIAKNDPQLREFFQTLEGDFNIKQVNFHVGENLRPFLSPLSWAYYKAYKSILVNDIIKFSVLKIGIGKDILKEDNSLKKLLEITLPDKIEYINSENTKSFYYLLEILENRLLDELKNFLKGIENTKESIELANSIIQQVADIKK